jgi:hypothetical protein
MASAAANGEPAARANPQAKRVTASKSVAASLTLDQRLVRVTRKMRANRRTLRFYASNGWYLRSAKHGSRASERMRAARRHLAAASRSEKVLRRSLARREARRLATAPPRTAICHVFGKRHCQEALAVSWCESRHSTSAQNGQYLGLFQMGSWERSRFGHGTTPHAQALAAHRYFVLAGSDWSPWSCKPWWAN